jgi:hypothetical protein
MKLARKISLENGLTVCFYRHIHRYFGDYHRVKVEIICEVPLLEEYFSSRMEFAEAQAHLGRMACYRRNLEMMGVSSAEVEQSVERTIENFIKHSRTYLSSPLFPQKLILAELAGAGKKTRRVFKE